MQCLSIAWASDDDGPFLSFVAATETGEYGEHFVLRLRPAHAALIASKGTDFMANKIMLGLPIE